MTLWIDPPHLSALLREAILPLVFLALLMCAIAALETRVAGSLFAMRLFFLICFIPAFLYLVAEWWQNAGTKKTVWRESAHRWPLREIRTVRVANSMLKVYRRRRLPLGAFTYRRTDHLEWIAKALIHGIQERRAALLAVGHVLHALGVGRARIVLPAHHHQGSGNFLRVIERRDGIEDRAHRGVARIAVLGAARRATAWSIQGA